MSHYVMLSDVIVCIVIPSVVLLCCLVIFVMPTDVMVCIVILSDILLCCHVKLCNAERCYGVYCDTECHCAVCHVTLCNAE